MTDAVILLVDDETGFVETMAKRLTRRNMEVHKAFEGETALRLLERHKDIEVVVLDMKMPIRDGLGVLRDIKSAHPLVEVIMLTGHATVESAIEGMQNGAYDYMMKPCDLEQLSAKIREAVAQKRRHEDEAVADRVDEIAASRP